MAAELLVLAALCCWFCILSRFFCSSSCSSNFLFWRSVKIITTMDNPLTSGTRNFEHKCQQNIIITNIVQLKYKINIKMKSSKAVNLHLQLPIRNEHVIWNQLYIVTANLSFYWFFFLFPSGLTGSLLAYMKSQLMSKLTHTLHSHVMILIFQLMNIFWLQCFSITNVYKLILTKTLLTQ